MLVAGIHSCFALSSILRSKRGSTPSMTCLSLLSVPAKKGFAFQ